MGLFNQLDSILDLERRQCVIDLVGIADGVSDYLFDRPPFDAQEIFSFDGKTEFVVGNKYRLGLKSFYVAGILDTQDRELVVIDADDRVELMLRDNNLKAER